MYYSLEDFACQNAGVLLFFVQKIGFEILDKKEDFTNDR